MKVMLAALMLAAAQQAHAPATAPVIGGPRGSVETGKRTVEGPLELEQATQDSEAVMAGQAYVQWSYSRPPDLTPQAFITIYRDALFAAGWTLIGVSKIDTAAPQRELLKLSAHHAKYSADMRRRGNLYVRVTYEPDGPIRVAIANVGDEDWASILAKECRLVVPSLHFDLDRPTLREHESEPTLEKLADLLKSRSAPPVEIQGHMDNIGEAGAAARQTLSEGRAKIVASWLAAHGVPAAKITSKGYGKTRPVAENDSDLGRALNRRIEVARRDCAPPEAGQNNRITGSRERQ